MSGSMSTTARRASGSVRSSEAILSSTSASICHTTMRSVICPIERASEMAVSSFSVPERTSVSTDSNASMSASVKALCPSGDVG